jgi:hypothetical protein
MTRPHKHVIIFMNAYDPMTVIGHYHEHIRRHLWKMDRDFVPTFLHDPPQIVEVHFTPNHLPKDISHRNVTRVTKYPPARE